MTDTCTLSAQGRALSTILTAFVGSIVTGITNGPFVAFFVGWICWVAAVRITIISAIGLLVTIFGDYDYDHGPFLAQTEVVATASNDNSSSNNNNSFDVTFLGSLGWIYTFIYTPPIQIMWLAANWSSASAALKVTRAIGLGVTALSYTFDTRARYGMALGRKFGSERVVPRLMNIYSAAMNMLLSVIVVVLLIRAVSQPGNDIPIYMAPLYAIFSIICAVVSVGFIRPRDGDQDTDEWWPDNNALPRALAGLVIGAFAGLAAASPAISMWKSAKLAAETSDNGNQGMGLQRWLGCKSVSWWEKAVQVLP